MNIGHSEVFILTECPELTEAALRGIIDKASDIKHSPEQKVIISRSQYIRLTEVNRGLMDSNHHIIIDNDRTLPMSLLTKIRGCEIIVL